MKIPRLYDLRIDHDKTQEDIANALGISQTNYSKYERGEIDIPVRALIRLAAIYQTSVDYILGLTDIMEPYPASSVKKRVQY